MIKHAAVAFAAIALLAGCSSPAPEPTPTKPAGPVEYGAVEDLRAAFVDAGGVCNDWKQQNQVTVAAQSGQCGGETVLSTFTTTADRDKMVATIKAISPDSLTLLVGPNWVINSSQVDKVYKTLGGTLVSK